MSRNTLYPRHGKIWSNEELDQMVTIIERGGNFQDVVKSLGRTTDAVHHKFYHVGNHPTNDFEYGIAKRISKLKVKYNIHGQPEKPEVQYTPDEPEKPDSFVGRRAVISRDTFSIVYPVLEDVTTLKGRRLIFVKGREVWFDFDDIDFINE